MNITIDLLSTNSIVTISCIVIMILGQIFGDSGKSTGWMFFLIPIAAVVLMLYWLFILSHITFYVLMCIWIIEIIISSMIKTEVR